MEGGGEGNRILEIIKQERTDFRIGLKTCEGSGIGTRKKMKVQESEHKESGIGTWKRKQRTFRNLN